MTTAPSSPALPAAAGEVRAESARIEQALERCGKALYRYFAVRVPDAATADDLMQQLWLQACKAPPAIPAEEHEYWLRRVARNLLIDHWRRSGKRPPHVDVEHREVSGELARQVDAGVSPDVILQRQEALEHVRLAITAMPAAEQELIIMHYVRGQAFQEIGEILGLSERAVEGRLYRARQELRRALAHLNEEDNT
jgi:RNA polymerase sigma-70 factor (ECF subfamily)